MEHVREALRLPADVVAEVDATRTAKRHREFVRTRLGVKYNAAKARTLAEEAIRAAAQAKDNPADLINVALDMLIRQGCELPGYTTLDEATKTIRTQVNRGFFTATAARIGPAHRAGLERLMVVDPATRRSAFDALKAPPKAATLGRFKERLQYMLALDALGPTEVWLRGVPPGKVGHFAGEARVTDVADLSKMKDDAKRLTLLASRYHPGGRRDWIKVKNIRHQEVIIGGWKPGEGASANTIGSLLLGVYDDDRLRYAGKAVDGVQNEQRDRQSGEGRECRDRTGTTNLIPSTEATRFDCMEHISILVGSLIQLSQVSRGVQLDGDRRWSPEAYRLQVPPAWAASLAVVTWW